MPSSNLMTSAFIAPTHTATPPAQSLHRHHTTWALLALIVLNYIGNFSHYAAFGVYEDDYLLTLPVFSFSQTDWWQRVASFITTWPQGRPIWWIANDTLTFAISRLDSLPFLYVIVFLSSSSAFSFFTLSYVNF